MSAAAGRRINRDDIEAKLREIRGEVDATTKSALPVVIAAGAVALVAVVGIAYLWGRRKGSKQSTVVEIRRV